LSAGNTLQVPSEPFCAHPPLLGVVVVVVGGVVVVVGGVVVVVVVLVVVVTGGFVVVVDFTGLPRPEDAPADAAASTSAPTAAATTSRKMRRMASYRQFGWPFLKAKALKAKVLKRRSRGLPLR